MSKEERNYRWEGVSFGGGSSTSSGTRSHVHRKGLRCTCNRTFERAKRETALALHGWGLMLLLPLCPRVLFLPC